MARIGRSNAEKLPNRACAHGLQPAAGLEIYIRNNGAQTLQIFPASGDAINGAAADASTTLAAGASVTYRTADSTNWYS